MLVERMAAAVKGGDVVFVLRSLPVLLRYYPSGLFEHARRALIRRAVRARNYAAGRIAAARPLRFTRSTRKFRQ
jgi:hypothetical protein